MAITKEELNKYQKKLSELSFDTKNSKIICDYSNKFIDFDELKKIRKTHKLPLSPDMVFYEDKVLSGFSEKNIEFDLEEIEGKFLDKVFTDSSKSFIEKWTERFNIEFLKEKN